MPVNTRGKSKNFWDDSSSPSHTTAKTHDRKVVNSALDKLAAKAVATADDQRRAATTLSGLGDSNKMLDANRGRNMGSRLNQTEVFQDDDDQKDFLEGKDGLRIVRVVRRSRSRQKSQHMAETLDPSMAGVTGLLADTMSPPNRATTSPSHH